MSWEDFAPEWSQGDSGGVRTRETFDTSNWDRLALATLLQEYVIAGHLLDRATMPHVLGRYGMDAMEAFAIAEWMGASPIWTRRIQQLLSFAPEHEGEGDVETIFKGMQFDIGAPLGYLDFQYEISDALHGAFHLPYCGALADAEPMGELFVQMMCHHIEDPTFDATAVATNPRARMTPVHRPPRVPEGRVPVCAWEVTIDSSNDPILPTPHLERMRATVAAHHPLPVVAGGGNGPGASDYAGPVRNALQYSDFSAPLLRAALEELALEGHLLSLSGSHHLVDAHGEEFATEVMTEQFVGTFGVVAQRLLHVFGLPHNQSGLLAVLLMHPMLRPSEYFTTMTTAGESVSLALVGGTCVEEAAPTWAAVFEEALPRLGNFSDDAVQLTAISTAATFGLLPNG